MALGKLAKGSRCSGGKTGVRVSAYKRCKPNAGNCSANKQIPVKGYSAKRCAGYKRKAKAAPKKTGKKSSKKK